MYLWTLRWLRRGYAETAHLHTIGYVLSRSIVNALRLGIRVSCVFIEGRRPPRAREINNSRIIQRAGAERFLRMLRESITSIDLTRDVLINVSHVYARDARQKIPCNANFSFPPFLFSSSLVSFCFLFFRPLLSHLPPPKQTALRFESGQNVAPRGINVQDAKVSVSCRLPFPPPPLYLALSLSACPQLSAMRVTRSRSESSRL